MRVDVKVKQTKNVVGSRSFLICVFATREIKVFFVLMIFLDEQKKFLLHCERMQVTKKSMALKFRM